MDVICVECGVVIPFAARQRRRCDECRVERFRSYRKPIRSLRAGEEPPPCQPGRYRNAAGYIRLRWETPTEYIEAYEHRLIVNAAEGQEVHHVNEDPSDNRPNNLKILSPQEHLAHHSAERRGFNVEDAVEMYNSGLGTVRIGRALGADPAGVHRALVAHGVVMRKGYGGPKRKGADS